MSAHPPSITVDVQVDEAAIARLVAKAAGTRDTTAPPSVTIPGVPTAISRELACDLIRALGIDPNELHSLSFDHRGIHVEVFALNPEGHRFTADGENVATHRMTIPILDKEPT